MNLQLFKRFFDTGYIPDSSEINELEQFVNQKPWFTTARVLLLKILKEQNRYDYADSLTMTALHVIDRKRLYEFLEKKNEFASETAKLLQHTRQESNVATVREREAQNSVDFSSWNTEYFSTNDFFGENAVEDERSRDDLIETFIKNNPKIIPAENGEAKEIDMRNSSEINDIASEILAEIYEKQGLYEQAIECYKKLSLDNPEKSIYFAGKIDRIKIKIN
ncbi:MAG: tetratricopeptide repeat protein [Prevotellaceae bacterium]|jgi:tetratricopeptide (TPR) repeat protein|nr:tetratricopeptide repeat protein [Prevotellaceae bacterium]